MYRAIAPDVLDSDFLGLQTLRHLMRMTRTWDSTMSMIPKGGDTIWGNLDWSPEDGLECKAKKHKTNDTEVSKDSNGENVEVQPEPINYGRLVSFGKDVAEAPSSEIEQIEFRVSVQKLINMFLPVSLGVVFFLMLLVNAYNLAYLICFGYFLV
jgi:phospholipid:diacylglycerol acyltransferase